MWKRPCQRLEGQAQAGEAVAQHARDGPGYDHQRRHGQRHEQDRQVEAAQPLSSIQIIRQQAEVDKPGHRVYNSGCIATVEKGVR